MHNLPSVACAVADDVRGDGVVEVTVCGVPVAQSYNDTSHMTKQHTQLGRHLLGVH